MMLPPNLHRTLDDENPDDEALRILGRQLRERGESYLAAAGYESELRKRPHDKALHWRFCARCRLIETTQIEMRNI